MTNSRTKAAPARANPGAARPAGGEGQQARRPSTIDEAIAKAQTGRVNVTPAKAVEMAGQLYSRGQYAQAERVTRQIIAARPGNADAQNILGVTLAALGNLDEGIASLQRAIKINPQAPSFHANLGEVLRQAGQIDEAAKVLTEALRLDDSNPQIFNNLGIICYEQRNFRDAVDNYRKALELRPTMAEALNNLGNALRMTGDLDGAINAYQEALTQRAVYP